MKILLTGATGYIGQRLLPALAGAGHEVVCLVRDARRFAMPDSLTEDLRPHVSVVQGDLLKPDTLADLGLTVTKSENGKGLVVTDVDPDSDAADRGIQPGDVITSVNSTEVNGTDDVTKAMTDAVKSGRKAVLMQITRDDTNRFVALPVAKG